MSFLGNGYRKPLNMLQNPVYPDIRKQPLEVKSAGKHWCVDSGRVQIDAEHHPQMWESAVLTVPHDYSTKVTGQSSHRDVVNKNFRPPIIEPYMLAESIPRQPRPPIVPNVNPDGTRWASRNEWKQDVQSYLSDLIKLGQIDAGFNVPFTSNIEMPLPDLELILSKTNIVDMPSFKFMSFADSPKTDLGSFNIIDKISVSADSGFSPLFKMNGELAEERMVLERKIPQVSVDSGFSPHSIDKVENYSVDKNTLSSTINSNPLTAIAYSGFNPMFVSNEPHRTTKHKFSTKIQPKGEFTVRSAIPSGKILKPNNTSRVH